MIVDPNDTGRVPGASKTSKVVLAVEVRLRLLDMVQVTRLPVIQEEELQQFPQMSGLKKSDIHGHEFMTYEASNLDQAALGIIG